MNTGVMRATPTKVLEMLLDLSTLGTVVDSAALKATYHLPWTDPRNLGIGHNWIWAKADKVNSKFCVIMDKLTLWCIFRKYRIGISTKEEWGKNWPNQLRKGHVWFTDRACNQ